MKTVQALLTLRNLSAEGARLVGALSVLSEGASTLRYDVVVQLVYETGIDDQAIDELEAFGLIEIGQRGNVRLAWMRQRLVFEDAMVEHALRFASMSLEQRWQAEERRQRATVMPADSCSTASGLTTAVLPGRPGGSMCAPLPKARKRNPAFDAIVEAAKGRAELPGGTIAEVIKVAKRTKRDPAFVIDVILRGARADRIDIERCTVKERAGLMSAASAILGVTDDLGEIARRVGNARSSGERRPFHACGYQWGRYDGGYSTNPTLGERNKAAVTAAIDSIGEVMDQTSTVLVCGR